MSLRATGATADNIDPNLSMSLRATGIAAHNIDPNSSMSLRTTGVTADNLDPNSSMSLRATGATADNIDPNSSMSLRATGVTAHNIDPKSNMSLRTVGEVGHGPPMPEAERVEKLWVSLRRAMEEKFPGEVGGQQDLVFTTLAAYLMLHLGNKTLDEVENILHDEFTAVQELASWEEPLVSEGLWSPEDLAGQPTEEELKEDLWDAVCKANESTSSKSSIKRFGAARVKGVPILDPPTVSSRNQLIREDQPYYIVAGFVKLFPLGHGDFWAHLQQRQEETREPLSFWEWIKHMLFRSDGRFQSHPRFYFFALNTALRNKALRARGYFLKRQQTAGSNNVAYTTEELFKMGKAQFTKIVSAFEHSMAGSAQEKLRQRSDLEAMVEQIEQETLEEQGHALLSAWNTAVSVADILQDKGCLEASRHVKSVCDAAKHAIDKVLSPETIDVAPKPAIKSVDPPPIPCVFADRGIASSSSRVSADREEAPSSSRVFADREEAPSSSRVFADREEISPSPSCTFAGHEVAFGSYENQTGDKRSIEDLVTELQQRSLCVQGGGEIPCHFTTLTTAIYHWDDLGKCLEKYEKAVKSRRGGRSDPLEPSERKLSEERRRVLRYPGVVAWFTGYKMELFYRHVLRYEDGQGVFEWGSGGIMHLHSINFGSCMPRVDPTAAGMQRPDATTAAIASRFAEIHEEYLTDWSLGKSEKWTFHEVDAVPARFRPVGSPIHTDSESDGSEDLEESQMAEKCVRRREVPGSVDVGAASDVFGQHVVADDVDFVRLFPTATTMSYVTQGDARVTLALSRSERETLDALEVSLQDSAWHPCQITVAQKALLMTNNCRLVRRARRKWYRRLTEKCNMHDRHSGGGVEIAPVHIEDEHVAGVGMSLRTATPAPDSSMSLRTIGTGVHVEDEHLVKDEVEDEDIVIAQPVSIPLKVATLNMHVLSPATWFEPMILKL